MGVRVDAAAAFLMLETDGAEITGPGGQDFLAWNCDGTEQALGRLREAIATLEGRAWTSAIIVPNKSVDQVQFG